MNDVLNAPLEAIELEGEEYQPEIVEDNPVPSFITRTPKELMTMDIPKLEYILYPWLYVGGLAIVSAPAGVGKTNLMLYVSKCICEGGTIFEGRWSAPFARNVLYVDGEMRLATMAARMKGLILPENFHLLSLNDSQPEELEFVNFADTQYQNALMKTIREKKIHLLVMDNLSCLYRVDRPNGQESFDPMKYFLLQMRRQGVAVVVVDHEGKGLCVGSPRGTSAKMDILDTSISLRRPEGYNPTDGALFEIRFTKTRDFSGNEATPFCVKLDGNEWTSWDIETNGGNNLKQSSRTAKEKADCYKLFHEGKTAKKVVEKGISNKTNVYRWYKSWKEENPFSEFDTHDEVDDSETGTDV